jgi:hypothetical protein
MAEEQCRNKFLHNAAQCSVASSNNKLGYLETRRNYPFTHDFFLLQNKFKDTDYRLSAWSFLEIFSIWISLPKDLWMEKRC